MVMGMGLDQGAAAVHCLSVVPRLEGLIRGCWSLSNNSISGANASSSEHPYLLLEADTVERS